MVLWDQRLPCPKYGFLLQSAMIDSVAYIIHSTLKKELRISRYVAKDQLLILTRLSTKNSKNSWQCYFVFFLTSCGNETGSHHNCCILGMLYRIVDSSYGWMEQLRIRGKIRKFLTTIFHSAMSFITSFMFFSVVSHGMRIQYVLTSLVRPFLWSDSISILFCLTTTRHIIILFGAHLPCTLKWKAISRKK